MLWACLLGLGVEECEVGFEVDEEVEVDEIEGVDVLVKRFDVVVMAVVLVVDVVIVDVVLDTDSVVTAPPIASMY